MFNLQCAQINTKLYIREGQIKEIDFVTGDIIRGEKISNKIVGYLAYFELLNGFTKSLYMTIDEIKAHAMKYSKSYGYDIKSGRKTSVWSSNFDSMAEKTVLKLLISKYGIISIDSRNTDMALALKADQSMVDSDGSYRYIDNEQSEENLISFSDVTLLQDTPSYDDTSVDESTEYAEEHFYSNEDGKNSFYNKN